MVDVKCNKLTLMTHLQSLTDQTVIPDRQQAGQLVIYPILLFFTI